MSAFVLSDNANDYRTTALRHVRGKDMTGKVVVVTGASGAMGKELTFAFYNTGATVIMAGRTLVKLEDAKEEIMKREIPAKEEFTPVKGGSMEAMTLDLGNYTSIGEFVKQVKAKYPKIYALVNNAGMIPSLSGYKESENGLETTFQTNFASTVVLTEKMLPLLKDASADGVIPRIVNVSSMSHAHASKPIDWSKIPSTKETFGGYNKDYAESKWLLTTYTSELGRRLESKVLAVSADPGVSPDSAMWEEQAAFLRFLVRNVFKFLTKTSPQAAGTAAYLVGADGADLKQGGYYQSGVYAPPRADTEDAESWKKAASILKQKLPEELKSCVVGA